MVKMVKFDVLCTLTQLKKSRGENSLLALYVLLRFLRGLRKLISIWIWLDYSGVTS